MEHLETEPKWFVCDCKCHTEACIHPNFVCCVDMCHACGKYFRFAFEAHIKSHGHYETLPIPK